MANNKKFYPLPDYTNVTGDIDQYIRAWRDMAAPVERALGLTLNGFDPGFVFIKGNPQTSTTTSVSLPVWFVRDLSEHLRQLNGKYDNLRANLDVLA